MGVGSCTNAKSHLNLATPNFLQIFQSVKVIYWALSLELWLKARLELAVMEDRDLLVSVVSQHLVVELQPQESAVKCQERLDRVCKDLRSGMGCRDIQVVL